MAVPVRETQAWREITGTFAASLRIARGELGETRDQLESAAQKKHIATAEHEELETLCRRALAANGGMIRFLDNNPDR